jgi:murein DD-endopeptidase
VSVVDFIGLKYLPKGRGHDGVDCWGLVQLFYKAELGLSVPSYSEDYQSPTDRSSVSEAIVCNLRNWVKVDKPEYGDILVFEILGLPLHTGVYIGNNDFLHSFYMTNSCIERLNSVTWNRRLLGIYRWVRT